MKRLFVLSLFMGLFIAGHGAKCPKHKNSPGKEVFCYTSSYDIGRLQDSICGCTALIHQGHDLKNFNASGLGALQGSLKETNVDLKFVLSVSDPQSALISSNDFRKEISDELIAFLKTADGVEINATAGSKERLVNFVQVIQDAVKSNATKKVVYVALPAKTEILVKWYDLKELTKYVDVFTLSTHYLVDEEETFRAFHPARLMGLFDMLNADSLVDLISGLGAPKDKIAVSAPASAYKFALENANENAPRSPTKEEQPVALDRKELCDLISKGEWMIERDDDLTAPYAFQNETWIAFDDKISLGIKGKYVLLRNLAGLGIQNIDNDLRTDCGNPLSHEVRHAFADLKRKTRQAVLSSLEEDFHNTRNSFPKQVKNSGYRITRIIDTKGHIQAVRENMHTEFTCTRQGFFVHPKSCNRFYRCVKFNQLVDDFSVFEFDCPDGLAFDERTEVCVWPGSLSAGSPCPGSSEIAPVPRTRFKCPEKPGYYADPENCRWFFACYDLGGPDMIAYEFRCPFGLVFDEEKLVCEWPWLVPKCAGSDGGGGGGNYGHGYHIFGLASGGSHGSHGKGYEGNDDGYEKGGDKGKHDGSYDDKYGGEYDKGGHDGGYDGGYKGGHDGGYDGSHKGEHEGGYDDGYKGGHDGGYEGGHKGGHDDGYDGGHKGGHDDGYDGSHKGGHDDGYDGGHKGGHDGGYDGGHKGGHDGGYDDGHKGGHGGGYDGGRNEGHDGGFDDGHKGGHDGGYDGGHKEGHDGGYDGGYKGGHDGGYDDGQKGGHDGGYDGGHKGGHEGGYDGGHKGGHDDGYDGGHKGGHDGGYDDGHKGGHDGGYDGGHKGGHDGGYDGGHKGGHDDGFDGGHKGGHDGGYDDGHKGKDDGDHKGGHDGGYDGGYKGVYDDGYDDHKGGHEGDYDGQKEGHGGDYDEQKGVHEGSYDGGHKDGHDSGYDHKGGHEKDYDGGYKDGHDGDYDGQKEGHGGDYDGQKGIHEGSYDGHHKGEHDGGYDGGQKDNHGGGYDKGDHNEGGIIKGGHDGKDYEIDYNEYDYGYGGHKVSADHGGLDHGQTPSHGKHDGFDGGFDHNKDSGYDDVQHGSDIDHGKGDKHEHGIKDDNYDEQKHKYDGDGEYKGGIQQTDGHGIHQDIGGHISGHTGFGHEGGSSKQGHEQVTQQGGTYGISHSGDIDVFKGTSEHPDFGDKVTSLVGHHGKDGATVTIYHKEQPGIKSGVTQSYGSFDQNRGISKSSFDYNKSQTNGNRFSGDVSTSGYSKGSGFIQVNNKEQPLGNKHGSSGSTYTSSSNSGYSGYSLDIQKTKMPDNHRYSQPAYTPTFIQTTNAPQSTIYKTNYNNGQTSITTYLGSPERKTQYSGSFDTGLLINNQTRVNNFGNTKDGRYITTGIQPGINYGVTAGFGKPSVPAYNKELYGTTQSFGYNNAGVTSKGYGVTSSPVFESYDHPGSNPYNGFNSFSGDIQKETPVYENGFTLPSTNYGVPSVGGSGVTIQPSNYPSHIGYTNAQGIIGMGQGYQSSFSQDINSRPGYVIKETPGSSLGKQPGFHSKTSDKSDVSHGLSYYGSTRVFGSSNYQTTPGYNVGIKSSNQKPYKVGYQNPYITSKGPQNDLKTVSGGKDATSPQTFSNQGNTRTDNVYTKEGFTKTGITQTGITTAQLGGSGSYVTGSGRPRPRPNPEYIGEKAFEGNVGYKRPPIIKTENDFNQNQGGLSGVKTTLSPFSTPNSLQIGGNGGYSTSSVYSNNNQSPVITTSAPFLNVNIQKEPPAFTSAPVTSNPFATSTFGYDHSITNQYEYKGKDGSKQQFDEIPFSYTSTAIPAGFTGRPANVPIAVTSYRPIDQNVYSQSSVTEEYPYQQQTEQPPDANLDISVSFQRPTFSRKPTTEQDFRDITVDDGNYGQKISTKGRTRYQYGTTVQYKDHITKDYDDLSQKVTSSQSVTPGYSYPKAKPTFSHVSNSNFKENTDQKTALPYRPFTTKPDPGFSYNKPIIIAEVTHQDSSSTSKPIDNSAVVKYSTKVSHSYSDRDHSKVSDVSKSSQNYNRGSARYTPNDRLLTQRPASYTRQPPKTYNQIYTSTTKTIDPKSSPPITTYSGYYIIPSSTPPCDIEKPKLSTLSPVRNKGNKVIVKYSDLHPLLLNKLTAECTCKVDPFDIFRKPGQSLLIESDRGKVDLANYDESQVYVDLEEDYDKDDGYKSISGDEQQSTQSSGIKHTNERISTEISVNTGKPSTYLPPVKISPKGSHLRISNSGQSPYKVRLEDESISNNRRSDSKNRSAKSLFKDSDSSTDGGVILQGTDCVRPGLFRHPKLCNKFYVCHWDQWKKKFTLNIMNCPIHLTFDPNAGACNWPSKGPACQGNNLLV